MPTWESDRRGPVAHMLALGAARLPRGSRTRTWLMGAVLVVFAVDLRHSPGWLVVAVTGCLLMMLGSYLSAQLAYLADRRAREAVHWARVAPPAPGPSHRVPLLGHLMALDQRLSDRETLNVSGLLEMVGLVVTAVALFQVHDPRAALVVFTLVLANCVSAGLHLFLDPALYSDQNRGVGWFERIRRVSGPASMLIALAVAVAVFDEFGIEDSAPSWENVWLWAAVVPAVSLLTLSAQVAHNDDLIRRASRLAEYRQQLGRKEINAWVHGAITLKMQALIGDARSRDDVPPEVRDHILALEAVVHETRYLENFVVHGLEWPGVLRAHTQRFLDESGCKIELHVDDSDTISDDDRQIAYTALRELGSNAAASGAEEAQCTLQLDSGRWVMEMTDDGRPISLERWKRAGGGLERFEGILRHRRGEIVAALPKTVRVTWTSSAAETPEDRHAR